MLVATWILAAGTGVLALATVVLAIEGGAALLAWRDRLRPGRNRREIEDLRRQVHLLQHAMWMDVSRTNQGSSAEIDPRIQAMLTMDGWQPDMNLMEKAGYFNFNRLRGR